MARMSRLAALVLMGLSFALLSGCSEEETTDGGPDRGEDDARSIPGDVRTGDTGHGIDVPFQDTGTGGEDTTREVGGGDASGRDGDTSGDDDATGDTSDAVAPDASPTDTTEEDTEPLPDLDCYTDADGDGHYAIECGGDDCDDDDFRVFEGRVEACDFKDNNCDGNVNEGIDCSFFAQTSRTLYKVDPFAPEAREVTSVPGLFDMDTDVDGTLYGITSSALYRFDAVADRWDLVGSTGAGRGVNGFAIDSTGRAFITGGNNLYSVDLASGSTRLIGSMGGGFSSSGDCVVNKDDSLFMSSNHGSTDSLILIDGRTGAGTLVGNTGFRSIYGLTAAWGFMFGLTSAGELIQIDEATGEGELIHRFSGITWYGAASTPSR